MKNMRKVGILIVNYRYRRSKPRVAIVPIILCSLDQVKFCWRDQWKGFYLHHHSATEFWLETINPKWRDELTDDLVKKAFNAMLRHVPPPSFDPEYAKVVSWRIEEEE